MVILTVFVVFVRMNKFQIPLENKKPPSLGRCMIVGLLGIEP